MGTRDERISDMYLLDQGATLPSEEGQVRSNGVDVYGYFDGEVKILTLPIPTEEGQVFISLDGATFSSETPLVSEDGWLANDDGILLVKG